MTVTAGPDPISIDDSSPQGKPAAVSKCEPTFDQAMGADRKSGIYNALLNPLGLSATYTDATDTWKITQAEPKPSMEDFGKTLAANGWEQFITDPNLEHKGFNDYKKLYNDNWYHLSVKPSTSTVWMADPYGISHTTQQVNPNEPPVDFSIHFEEAEPGGVRHGINFTLSALTKAASAIGMTNWYGIPIAKKEAKDFEHLPPCVK